MSEYQVAAVFFEPDAMVISYMQTPDDVRVSGAVVAQHQLRLALGHPDYAEDAQIIQRRAVSALKNALEDFHDSEPYVPDEDETDDNDERGMGE